jgi:serine phosphatase RsbU (regulator of sigma subunit)
MQRSLEYRLTSNYLLALGFIAFLTIVSYAVIRYSFSSKDKDGSLIRMAGRQGILSQQIIRTALVLEHKERNTDFSRDLKDLNHIFKEWENNHKALLNGDHKMNLDSKKSKHSQTLWASIEIPHQSIKKATEVILATPPTHDESTYGTLKIAVDSLLKHEKPYLNLIHKITQQYEKEAIQRLNMRQSYEFWLVVITLFVLFLEVIFIFRPAVKRTTLYFEQLQLSHKELEKVIQELKTAEENNRQKNEELRASEEEIRQNMEELSAINENLVKSTDELRQKNEILNEATKVLDLKNQEIRRNRDQLFEQSRLLETKNENITNSIRYARRIQDAIIPEPSEITKNFNDAFVLYHPRDIVSGDFYWFSEKHSQKVIIAADCTGHGVPGALMTMMGNSLINEIVNEKGITNPSEILHELDKKIIQTLQRPTDVDKKPIHDGMDIAVLTVDPDNRTLQFASAHNPLYYVQDGEMQQVKGSKFPVGSLQYGTKLFELNTIQGKPGDVFYIFTDGFQDQYSQEAQRKYMSKRFRNFLLLISHLPLAEQQTKLAEEFDIWKGDSPQTDDILIIGIKL